MASCHGGEQLSDAEQLSEHMKDQQYYIKSIENNLGTVRNINVHLLLVLHPLTLTSGTWVLC